MPVAELVNFYNFIDAIYTFKAVIEERIILRQLLLMIRGGVPLRHLK